MQESKPIRSFDFYLSSHRTGIGSFHSDSIESLIKSPVIPKIWSDISLSREHIETVVGSLSCGEDAKSKLFLLKDSWTFINHGAFGSVFKPLLEEAQRWQTFCEEQPLRFYDRELFPLVAFSLRKMSKFLQSSTEELFFIRNVTYGLNCIVNCIQFDKGDSIVCFSLTYGSTKKILSELARRYQLHLLILTIELPLLPDDELIKHISSQLPHRVKLVVLDHITSNTAQVLPIKTLSSFFKSKGSIVVVDAAHSLMSVDISLDLKSNPFLQNVDYWLTNCHKWFCNNKGSAIMWIHPRNVEHSKPLIISHGYIQSDLYTHNNRMYIAPGKLHSAFSWEGTANYSSFLTIPSCIHLWQELNKVAEIKDYSTNLIENAVDLLQSEWKLPQNDVNQLYSRTNKLPMALVPLPQKLGFQLSKSINTVDTNRLAFSLQEWLYHECHIEVPVKCVSNRLCIRLSGHIYNSMKDYIRLALVVKSLL